MPVPGSAIDTLRVRVAGEVLVPMDPGYEASTSPLNSTAEQNPGVVVVAREPQDVCAAVAWANATGASVAVQATGHGAAGRLDDSAVLIDTSGLADIEIDAERRIARCGSGVVWRDIAAATRPHGLAGLAGTAPTVGIAGYTFNGGWGWLTRPHGLASARLRAVDYVDAEGTQRRVEDGEALWVYRGGGGIGIATALEFGLVPIPRVIAGFRLWPLEQMADVIRAWAAALPKMPAAITTNVSLLKTAPPAPGIPDELQGEPVCYLGLCATEGEALRGFDEMLEGRVPAPIVDTVGEMDLTELSSIHLDPPDAVPAHGDGFFLDIIDGDHAVAVFEAAQIGPDDPLNEIELRHVGTDGQGADTEGALTTSPAPLVLHATGGGANGQARAATQDRLDAVREAAAGKRPLVSAHAFRDGRTDAPGSLPREVLARLTDIRQYHDPGGIFVHPRIHA